MWGKSFKPFPSVKRLLCLHPGGDEAHVNAPAEADGAQENNTPLHGNEAEADDGGDGPDLVAGDDDRDRLLTINGIST